MLWSLAILSVIEFRMAKTLWSFGQFSIIGLERPKQYGVLAILSAVGLKELISSTVQLSTLRIDCH